MNKSELLKLLNIKDPYPYIRSLNQKYTDIPAWGGTAGIFDNLIKLKKPKLIIELGAFLGGSTITMAKSLKNNKLDCVILTVDTWLGSQEHWLQTKCNMLHLFDNFEYGISSLYNKFATNVICENVEDFIIPLPTTTDTAYDVIKSMGLKADMIYMDADHREEVIYADLIKYSDLLNEDGVIFGHDIDWVGVRSAVNKYCLNYNKQYIELEDNTENKIKFWQII